MDNNGKVSRYRSNELGTLNLEDRRKPEPRRFDPGPAIDWLGVWIAIVGLAVVIAVFGDTLYGRW